MSKMKALGLDVAGLARSAKTHRSTISNWLNGERPLSKDVGLRVAAVLGATLQAVLFDWAPKRRRGKKRSG